MTTEDEFQALLDAHPDDHQTRLVFADWLDERGDTRAEGYRALGTLRIAPANWTRTLDRSRYPIDRWCYHNGQGNTYGQPLLDGILPTDWLLVLTKMSVSVLAMDGDFKEGGGEKNPATRREAEDAAARAFAKLPQERRAELLAGRRNP